MSFELIQLMPLLTCFTSAFVSGYIWSRRRSTAGGRAFLWFNAFVFLCCLSEFFLRLPLRETHFAIAARTTGLLLIPLAALYLEFVRAFVRGKRSLLYWVLASLNIGSALSMALAPTVNRVPLASGGQFSLVPTSQFAVAFLVGMVGPAVYASLMCTTYIRKHRRTLGARQLSTIFSGIVSSVFFGIAAILLAPALGFRTSMSSLGLFAVTIATYVAVRRYSFLSVNIEQVEQAFDGLFESRHDAVFLLDCSGLPVRVNTSGRELFGRIGVPLTAEGLGTALKGYRFDNSYHDESVETTSGDSTRYFLMSQSPVGRDANSQGKLLTLRDVTRQREMEDELFRIRSMESIAQLAAGIAHDFNNYLCGITSCFALARMSVDTDSEEAHLLREGERAALQAQGLTQQLLTFSRGGTVREEVFDLAAHAREVAELAVRGTAARLVFELPDRELAITGDPTQVGQVVQNLVVNAVQAMHGAGTVRVRVWPARVADGEIAGLADGSYAALRVRDSGPGVDKRILPRIFDPYFTTKEGGNGIGLAVVFSVLRRHNGAVTVGSPPGGGAAFTVYFPAGRGAVPRNETGSGQAEAADGGRVLVMDDNGVVRTMLTKLIERFGYPVDAARNGEEALAMYERARGNGNSYRLVITDLTVVGGMSGRELAAKLHEKDPGLPIVISSGYSEEVEIARYREFGFAGVLHKPYDHGRLREVLETACRARGCSM